ncbi:lipocalin-like domain-containing protein [Pseudomonas sp. BNK-15]|uniref:lipocalin-like domain-containing protein n=1 Tax=Pseudomonas sp. BNK-15 TaxID=3376152 RepID=UPI0039BF1C6F
MSSVTSASVQAYLAYSGPYAIDTSAHKLTHTISVSLHPNWAGLNQVRNFRVEDDKRLYLSFERPQMSRGAMRTADLVWERATPN